MTTVSQEAVEVTQALKYSRMADPEAWENADVGRHSRENNIRLARANAMGKARYLSELLAGFSQSQFVEAAASENGENLLNALVGVLSDYPNHRQQAERGEAWRPIETAPKDGTWFLAYWPVLTFEDRIQITRWLHGDCRFVDASDFMDHIQPTHWQPLPTPPEAVRTPIEGTSHAD